MKTTMQQAPIRSAQTIAASIYSHSGEFAPDYTDLRLTSRGLDLEFTRFYRSSLADHIGELGRGWSCGITKKIEREGDDVLYHNGAGEVHRFLRGGKGEYTSPVGFYGMLLQEKEEFVIRQCFGRSYRFHVPEAGGGILSIEDRNHNIIQFSYSASSVVILDTMRRRINISVNKGLMHGLTDHAGRSWKYVYDKDHRLVEVIQPATADFPHGTSLKYAYDNNHRLISLTDAKGQTYLVNSYDTSGRVAAQKHGSGVYKMEYEPVGTTGSDGFPAYRTICRRKNGSTLVVEHNEAGNVIVSTLQVRRDSFAPEDITGVTGNEIPVITTSTYNRNAELTSRRFPTGHETKWTYTERESNPLNQGNLSQITELPQAGVESDQASIVTKYEYESSFQLLASRTDPRGHKTSHQYDPQGNLIATTYPAVSIQPVDGGDTRAVPLNRTQQCKYAYNSMGQLLRRTDIDGSVTAYHYYPIDDPCGTRGPGSATAAPDRVCGYLARVVRDADGAKIKNEYAYDQFGNVAAVFDGKSNAARLRYNAMGKVERVTGRSPFKHRIDYKYDANYNEIESAQSFERAVYDETTRETTLTSTTLRELKEYNALDNVTARRIIGDDKVVTESFVRDANERIIRQIQPLGNVTGYVFDERDLLIEKIPAAGTKETFTERFAYTLNGAVRSQTDGNGNTTMHHYDGFQRYRGFTDPAGTTKTQSFDEADNVVRVRVDGDNGSPANRSKAGRRESVPLMEAHYHFDQWNRAYRMDQAWHDPATGKALGESTWNGEKGIVSTVVEYAQNGLPGKIWSETANVVAFEYDGAGRLTAIKDLTGEERSFEYDENGNATLLRHRGPDVVGQRFEAVLRRSYDAMDRLESQQENDDAPERFRYDALGSVINYVGTSGIEIRHTLDSLGRRAGHAFTVAGPADGTKSQQIVRRYEYDDNYRLSAYVDATGNRTIYGYDALGRQSSVVYPDGTVARVGYDAKGNVFSAVDPNDNEIINRYDASDRLIERSGRAGKKDTTTIERYEYDGAGRLLSAIAPGGAVRHTYDSLSRLLAETQGDRTLRYAHDAAGNLTSLVYPSGEEVHWSHDLRNRVTAVHGKAGARIASYSYRANDQVTGMLLGDTIETALSYNPQQRLESIEYRRTADHALVEGFRYQYDATGKMTHEIQSIAGASYGERYFYDDAHRAIRAQYGVQDVFDPNSAFEQETSYEHFAEGSWQRRVDVDGQRRITEEQVGTVDQRNRYQQFGKFSFDYDANGNCVRKESSNPGSCIYTYDQDNRLIKAECYDAHGHREQTIEYSYDALGRQVLKVVTDKNGVATKYTYVWAGRLLIEEYETGGLARTYLYGLGAMPIQFSSYQGRRTDYIYVFNGKRLASGLLHKVDPNAFAEKYGYELIGASFMKEINGVTVGIPSRKSTISKLVNSVLSGDYLKDWANGSDSSIGGMHTNREIDAVLNSVNKGQRGVRGALNKQNTDFLNVIGRGSSGKGPTGAGPNSGSGRSEGESKGAGRQGGPPPGVQLGSRAPNWSLYGADGGTKKDKDKDCAACDPTYDASDTPLTNKQQEQLSRDMEKARKANEDAKKKDGGNVDPDSAPVSPMFQLVLQSLLPSSQQIEAKLMQNKRPVDPNGGPGSSNIDPSSPPPTKGGWDPTVAYIDSDAPLITFDVGVQTIIIGGGYTTFVRGWQPPKPEVEGGGGGTFS